MYIAIEIKIITIKKNRDTNLKLIPNETNTKNSDGDNIKDTNNINDNNTKKCSNGFIEKA